MDNERRKVASNPIHPLFRTAILGQPVVDVERDEDGLGIRLAEGWDISVWSACSLHEQGVEIDLQRVSEIIGASLVEFVREYNHERLVFSQGHEVIVDLDARSPSQPEAMMVQGPNSLIVVWND